MKYEYHKPRVDIKNWLVSREDISRLTIFFRDRFSSQNVRIELKTASGNNRSYEDDKEFNSDLAILEADKEIVRSIGISHRETGEDWHHFKQMWIEIDFSKYGSASFHLIAGDTDNSYKDWVAGTYEGIKKLKEVFEIKDQEFIKRIKQRYPSTILFDPDKKIKASIDTELKAKDKDLKTTSKGERWWERTWVQVIIIIGALAGILSLYSLFK